jgi:hypothetical protein
MSVCMSWIQPSPSPSEASARKKRGCSMRLGPRCDVTAGGALGTAHPGIDPSMAAD